MNRFQVEGSSPTDRIDPEGTGFVNCCKAIANLAAASTVLTRRTFEMQTIIEQGLEPDPGHLKALQQAQSRTSDALDQVMKHCGGTAAGAAAVAAAKAVVEAAQELLDAWRQMGEPIPG